MTMILYNVKNWWLETPSKPSLFLCIQTKIFGSTQLPFNALIIPSSGFPFNLHWMYFHNPYSCNFSFGSQSMRLWMCVCVCVASHFTTHRIHPFIAHSSLSFFDDFFSLLGILFATASFLKFKFVFFSFRLPLLYICRCHCHNGIVVVLPIVWHLLLQRQRNTILFVPLLLLLLTPFIFGAHSMWMA